MSVFNSESTRGQPSLTTEATVLSGSKNSCTTATPTSLRRRTPERFVTPPPALPRRITERNSTTKRSSLTSRLPPSALVLTEDASLVLAVL